MKSFLTHYRVFASLSKYKHAGIVYVCVLLHRVRVRVVHTRLARMHSLGGQSSVRRQRQRSHVRALEAMTKPAGRCLGWLLASSKKRQAYMRPLFGQRFRCEIGSAPLVCVYIATACIEFWVSQDWRRKSHKGRVSMGRFGAQTWIETTWVPHQQLK